MNPWKRRPYFFVPLLVAMLGILTAGCTGSSPKPRPGPDAETSAELPDISVFLTKPSDRFLVDVAEITGGHPFKGVNSKQPHAGAHVHFDNSENRWPKDGTDPGN